MITPGQISIALVTLKPADLEATHLLQELHQRQTAEGSELSATDLLAISPRLEAALAEAERLSEQSRRIVRQCLDLKPVPQSKVPLGF